MKVFFSPLLAIIALTFCFNASAQDIIYTISAEIDHQTTTLDSISVENLTKQSSFGFGELPERDDYRINLTQNKFWGSTSVYNLAYDNSLYLHENRPGLVSVGYNGQTATNASITLYNVNGQKLLAKNDLTLDMGSLVEVEINQAGVYLLYINTPSETKTFKAIGASKSGQLAIALQSNSTTPLKSGQLYHVDNQTQTGDNIKIRVFKNNYVAAPIEITVEKDTSLVFALDSITAPAVQTLEATNILSTSATLNGIILNNGNSPIIECGFYWSATNENPGEADNKIIVDGTTGSFSAELSGLELNTSYYLRAFANNSKGKAYGEQMAFTTESWLRDTQTTIFDVINPATGRTWMDRNLGASRAATSSTDTQAYGDYYQWGRAADGHQKRNSPTTSFLSSSDTPGHGNFILAPNSPFDWRNPQNPNLWQGVNGINNPCPIGYRLPTEVEWKVERQSWNSKNAAGAFASPLKLPMAGGRSRTDTGSNYVGREGFYWSSDVYYKWGDYLSLTLGFTSKDAPTSYSNFHAWASSVRCIKDGTTQATLPIVTTAILTYTGSSTANSGGEVTSSGFANITARGVCWNTTGNPTIADNKTSNGTGTGSFTSNITGLTANTTYYVRAYATNSQGTAYGEQKNFTTSEFISLCNALDNCNLTFTHSGNAEWFSQSEVSFNGGSSAQSGSINSYQHSTMETTVEGPGIVSFYWKVSSESNYDKLNFYIGSTLKDNISGNIDWELQEYEIPEGTHTLKWRYTKDGSSSGGQDCGWLDKIVYTIVEPTLPTVTTANITNISQTTASTGGEVTSSGFASITARGVCWNTSENPTISDNKTSNRTGAGSFTSNIKGLTASTTYYVRAYATNSEGTAYGEQKSFTTLIELCEALDNCDVVFTSNGDAEWYSQNKISYFGGFSARSGAIKNRQESSLEANITGPCLLSFRWKVSSENDYDKLFFYIDNVQQNSISGEMSWHHVEVEILEGNHTIKWSYVKDDLEFDGEDCGWIDKVVLTETHLSLPVVVTSTISNIAPSSAHSGGEISSSGFTQILNRGVCWNTTGIPTTDDNKTVDNVSTNTFMSNIKRLKPETTYFVRAYATNSIGTAYGNTITFTTTSIDWPKDTVTQIIDVLSPITGKIWMDRNLGASRAATSSTDSLAFGDLYQWGRSTDGHQKRNSITTTILSNSNNPSHEYFIINSESKKWLTIESEDRWQGVYGINNPCPNSYRIPSFAEWKSEYNSWSSMNAEGAYFSPLKLTKAGIRRYNSGGNIEDVATTGYYHHSTFKGINMKLLFFNDESLFHSTNEESSGLSVRCIKDDTENTESLCEAVDNCDLEFIKSGDSDWYSQSVESFYGNNSIRSGSINDEEQSTLETFVTGPGFLSFMWKVSSEFDNDMLKFYIGTNLIDKTSGNVDWKLKEFEIPEGNHTLKWSYKKDNYKSEEQDCGWLDKIVFYTGEPTLPTVKTANASNITQAWAISGGEVISSGFAIVTNRGVCWNTTGNPTIANSKTSNGTSSGTFTSVITDLTANTTYFLRAYATNSQGTAYGEQISFTTLNTQPDNVFVDQRDGNVYHTVTIGNQVWMAENLKFLPSVVGPLTSSRSKPYYYVYRYVGNIVDDAKATSNYSDYGVLYNWSAAMTDSASNTTKPRSDVQGVCPNGWHLPSNTEWTTLTSYLGGQSVAGGKLKETGTMHWRSPNTGATNETGFTALAGGHRGNDGRFWNMGSDGTWWSTTELDISTAVSRSIINNRIDLYRYYDNKDRGLSVRCIKD